MSIDSVREFIKEKAQDFGAKTDNEFNKPYIERNNTGHEALQDKGAYFGFIHPEEDASGPFHDFSLTIFPNEQGKPWLVCLGIGSSGFKNDYELASLKVKSGSHNHICEAEHVKPLLDIVNCEFKVLIA